MPPRTNRWKQLANARAAIGTNKNVDNDPQCDNELGNDSTKYTKIAPKQMAVACLLSGTNPTRFRETANICNIKTPAMSTYFEAQKKVIPTVIEVANRTVELARQESFAKKETIASTDACWDSARNGKNSTTSAIDCETGKTIDYEIVTRAGGNRVDNFQDASNMMESEGLKRIASRLHGDPNCNIVAFVHDGDNKSDKILEKAGFNLENQRDAGHGFKALERRFKSMKKEVKSENKLPKDPFHGIQGKVINYAKSIVSKENDPRRREELWLNVPEHLTGNHSICHHNEPKKSPGRPRKVINEKHDEDFAVWKGGIEHPEAKEALSNFCQKTVGFIDHCAKRSSTQGNEAQNSMIAKEADKNINYGPSYPARVAVAIGKKNDPRNFVIDVIRETNLDQDIDEDIMQEISDRWNKRADQNEKRRSKYERERITKARANTRTAYKTKKNGDYNEDKTNFDDE